MVPNNDQYWDTKNTQQKRARNQQWSDEVKEAASAPLCQ